LTLTLVGPLPSVRPLALALVRAWRFEPLSAGIARSGIRAILTARASIASRVPRPVPPHIAISVTVAAVAISIPITAACAAAISILAHIALRRALALRWRGRSRGF
jgi:hypothetical protein